MLSCGGTDTGLGHGPRSQALQGEKAALGGGRGRDRVLLPSGKEGRVCGRDTRVGEIRLCVRGDPSDAFL